MVQKGGIKMKKRTEKTLKIIICADALCIALAAVFAAMSALTLYVTFLTTAYHFTMRLIVGEAVTLICKNREFNVNSPIFRIHRFEKRLYEILRVKKWKKYAITAKPEQFDIRKNTPEEILSSVFQAELGHLIMAVLSFVPLILIIPYGAPVVFAVTSVFGCLLDLVFVMIQRYNTPRVIKFMEKRSANAY